jgi:sRNA-binding carbon storage regulator CsrA
MTKEVIKNLNREERRALARKPPKRNPHDPNTIIQFEKTLKLAKDSVKNKTEPVSLKNGDKVKLNVEAIKNRPNYIHMNENYKKFVDENENSVFTVKLEYETNNRVVSFEEESSWLFWCGDLILIHDKGD